MFCLSNVLCSRDTKSVTLFLSFQSFLNSVKIAILGSQWKRNFMRSGMSGLLCVSIIRLFISPFVPLLFVPTALLESLSLSQFSLPCQLFLYPLILAFHLPPSLSRYLTTVVSFSVPAIFPFPLPSFLRPLIPSTLPPLLRRFFPRFLPLNPTRH